MSTPYTHFLRTLKWSGVGHWHFILERLSCDNFMTAVAVAMAVNAAAYALYPSLVGCAIPVTARLSLLYPSGLCPSDSTLRALSLQALPAPSLYSSALSPLSSARSLLCRPRSARPIKLARHPHRDHQFTGEAGCAGCGTRPRGVPPDPAGAVSHGTEWHSFESQRGKVWTPGISSEWTCSKKTKPAQKIISSND